MDAGEKKEYKRILFSDLDGTLITTVTGKVFPEGCYDVKPRLEVFEAIKRYAPDLVVIVTNQGGIEAGFVNPHFFKNKAIWVTSMIAEYCKADCRIEYCPVNDTTNRRRKPNCGMITDVLDSIPGNIEEKVLLMIGDREDDMHCAENANIEYINVENFVMHFLNY